jgi:EAL domain-containing protein (putative c-di-GMP-specific phosphodiesterase class I)/ABC-type amino acid transport substrate-binding protein
MPILRIIVALLAMAGVFPAVAVQAGEQLPSAVVFGGDQIYPPFEWSDDGTPIGFNIDLAEALAEVGGVKAEHRLGDWPDMIRALEAGEVDVVPMFVSAEREKKFRFTSAFHYVSHGIYANRAEAAIGVEELAGDRVAVEQLSYAHHRLQQETPDTDLLLTGNTLEALQAVAQGKARYAVLAIPTADRLIQIEGGLDLRRIGPPFWPQGYAFAVRKDRVELAKWLDQSLALAIGTGRYEDVHERWKDRLQPADIPLGNFLVPAATIAAALLVLIALGFGWSISLRRVVSARTAQLNEELLRNETAKADIKYLADHDADTGLAKHHRFIELVDERLRKGGDERLELAVLKLAGIETIIGTFGYQVSKSFVEAFSDRIGSSGFHASGYLGRGVFAVLASRGAIGDQVNGLTAHLSTGKLALYPQLVTGVAYWPGHGASATELVRHAETALASSVARSRSRTVYDSSIEPDQLDLEIVGAFRESNGTALRAFLQPQVDLRTGRIVAAEALVRWNHPDLGDVPPAKFIPLLEGAGLVGEVTAFMIDEAARIAASLRRQMRPCVISVNISAKDLLTTDLCSIVAAAVERRGTRPSDIKLELTETSAAQDPEQVRLVLEALKEAGISTSIDDFGTGYSSLIYLSTFPVSEVKIDRTFVRDMALNARNNSIVRSTVAVAQELGLTAVAEGAEDEETLAALRDIGCDMVQGYVISKPLPEDEFYSFLRTYDRSARLAPAPPASRSCAANR